jgi:hypothetical protein
MGKGIHWLLLLLAGLFFLGLAYLGYSADPRIAALRNVAHFKAVKALGGPQVRSGEPPGILSGSIRDGAGRPVPGGTVLLSSPLGHTYRAETDAAGEFRIAGVPPGRYVPVAGKRGFEDALNQACFAGLCYRPVITVRPGAEAQGIDLRLSPAVPLEIGLDDSLLVSPTMEVEVGAPFPSTALRTRLSFERDGLWVNDCFLYEPAGGSDPLPTLLLVLPGPVENWEIIPVPFATQGFSLVACYPLRGADIDGDAADLLTALEYVREGRVASRADPERLGLIGASFTSLHTYRILRLTDQFDVALELGGMSDGFAFRHDVEMGTLQTRPPFGEALMALGFPNSSPELYFTYSILYHLEGLPPLCLLHGVDDELAPFSQSVQLAEELARRGHPHEFYSYDGLSHYFVQTADDATTQQMFQDSLDCLRRWLAGE